MGTIRCLKRPPRQGTSQPGWHFHQRDAGRGTFFGICVILSCVNSLIFFTITFGHPSLTLGSSAGSNSSGTLNHVADSLCTQLLFCGIVFISLMLDSLSRFSSVKCWLSPFATSSLYCSLGITLRSNIFGIRWFFCRILFLNMLDRFHSGWWPFLFLFCFVMDARVGGVVATSAWHVECHVGSLCCVPWSTSVA